MKLAAATALVGLIATALPASMDTQITRESVDSLLGDMQQVYLTGDGQKVEGFLTHHLADGGTYAMTVRYTIPAMGIQQKPQTRSLSKSDFIHQTVEGVGKVKQYRYSLRVNKVEIEEGGKAAQVTIVTNESGQVPHPVKSTAELRLSSTGTCTLTLAAQIGLPAIDAMDCDMQTVMR